MLLEIIKIKQRLLRLELIKYSLLYIFLDTIQHAYEGIITKGKERLSN